LVDSDCASGECGGGGPPGTCVAVPTSSCTYATSCGSDNCTDGTCQCSIGLGWGLDSSRCITTADCCSGTGAVCYREDGAQFGSCLLPSGALSGDCNLDTVGECASQQCEVGVGCLKSGQDNCSYGVGLCTGNSDCSASGDVCSGGTCELPGGDLCSCDAQCSSGLCGSYGWCVCQSTNGAECYQDGDCCSPYNCIGNGPPAVHGYCG
jgi:hypothetical protein